ncbi:terpenoid cyclases/protein prenyltransferase alpha-alpha toroid [Lipomyces arxii]|uniref:terpenoid cyclases/protein prenyltransferase alpha-alpha toroid n=1 Tax=Lipomyces arxii TaxID=56418 RepID=UPI0034CD5C31
MYAWFLSLKTEDGGFRMNSTGEEDVRAVYCCLASAALLNILTPELVEGVADYVSRCQTYEGGIGASPGNEAHAGYAFCGLAALCILYDPRKVGDHIDLDSFVEWLSQRQYQPEGGFSGRTNKLVDGCYCWWVGGCWALLEAGGQPVLWSKPDLQKFVLSCCQAPRGGLRDKPGVKQDFYHSCYVLSGLSEAQYRYSFDGGSEEKHNKLGEWSFMYKFEVEHDEVVLVDDDNAVGPLNPVHVLPWQMGEQMHAFYVAVDD